MLVRLPQSLVISEYFNYDRFGEIVLALPLAGESRPFTPTAIEEPGRRGERPDRSPTACSRITLDDGLRRAEPAGAAPPERRAVRARRTASAAATPSPNTVGVLGLRLQPVPHPADRAGGLHAASTRGRRRREPVGGTLRVAAHEHAELLPHARLPDSDPATRWTTVRRPTNLECRGADSDQPTEFTRQRDKLLAGARRAQRRRARAQRDREHRRRRSARRSDKGSSPA